jgi:hypothetical protein
MEAPSPHEGSKPRSIHLTDTAQDRPGQIARAQAWSESAGKPVPPRMRFRRPLDPAAPLSSRQRLAAYRNRPGAGTVAPEGRLTPAQARRLRHKHGRPEARMLGLPPPPAPGPRAPRTPAQRARFRKNAAQQDRCQNRLPR